MKRKRLQNSLHTKKRKVASLQREMKQIQKCMRRKIAYANKTGTCVDVMGELYIKLPRALCDTDDMPTKGQKSLVTDYYTYYKGNYLL